MVSPEDAWLLTTRRWYAQLNMNSNLIVYAQAGGRALHREILSRPSSDIDHRDHDSLNNRRANLRTCTDGRNLGNGRHRIGSSGFRGVHEKENDQWARSEPTTKAGMASCIGSDMSIVGNIECKGPAQVFGRIEGEVRASDLQINDGAQVEGSVIAQNVTVCGRVKGTIRAVRSGLFLAMMLAASSLAAAETPLTIDQLLAQGWEIAGYASGYDNRTSLILFRHPGVNALVQCGILYDVTRAQRTVVNCYELR